MKLFISLTIIIFFISSCQKEFLDPNAPTTGSGSGSGGGSSTNGDLLIKGVSITGSDTNTINLKWDSNKKLIQYLSSGRTNGVAVNSRIDITRESNGNIKKVFTIPLGASGYIDSIITYVIYQAGTSKISFIKNINYTSILGSYSDSSLITYNSAGKISVKETYLQNFITGVYEKQSKNNYTYDAPGNLITSVVNTPDAGGNYTPVLTISNTYDSHLAAETLGDDAFVVTSLGEEATSVNNLTKKMQSGSGSNVTLTITQQQFNITNRPTSGLITATPIPPGYTLKYTYYYQ